MKHRVFSPRGSALLLVLWALLFLSGAVFTWAVWIHDGLALHADGNRALEARAMAHSGMAVALHPRISRQSPLPQESLAPGMGYRLQIVSEGGKLNLNWLLRGEEPAKLALLKRWLEGRGLDVQQREALVDSLLDYGDGDDLRRLNGDEGNDSYRPANRELRGLHELARIPAAQPLTTQPGWSDELTLHSQGPIDLTAASLAVLRLLPGLNENRLRQFVQYRAGPDGLDGTPDDVAFKDLGVVRQFLGLGEAQFKALAPLVSYKDPTLRIVSTGFSGEVTRQLEVIARKGGAKPQLLLWKE